MSSLLCSECALLLYFARCCSVCHHGWSQSVLSEFGRMTPTQRQNDNQKRIATYSDPRISAKVPNMQYCLHRQRLRRWTALAVEAPARNADDQASRSRPCSVCSVMHSGGVARWFRRKAANTTRTAAMQMILWRPVFQGDNKSFKKQPLYLTASAATSFKK